MTETDRKTRRSSAAPEITPEEVQRAAEAQGTDEPSIPRGRNPDSAMCEDRDRPGHIDKSNDC